METVRRRSAALIVTLLLAPGCEEDPVPTTAAQAAAGSGGKPPVELVCPKSEPINAAACNSTLFCTYPMQVCQSQTANTTASCVDGRWLVSRAIQPICETPYRPMPFPCPGALPTSGTPCPSGDAYTTSACAYPTPECPSAGAICEIGQWFVLGCGGGGAGGGGAGGAGETVLAGAAGQADGGQTSLGGAGGSAE